MRIHDLPIDARKFAVEIESDQETDTCRRAVVIYYWLGGDTVDPLRGRSVLPESTTANSPDA